MAQSFGGQLQNMLLNIIHNDAKPSWKKYEFPN